MAHLQQVPSVPDGVRPTQERVDAAIRDYSLHNKHSVPLGCAPDAIKLFVGNLPRGCLEDSLRPIFSRFGNVVDISVVRFLLDAH